MGFIGSGLGIAVFLLVFIIFKWINILNEYERGVIFRLGRVLKDAKGPGLVIVMMGIDSEGRLRCLIASSWTTQ